MKLRQGFTASANPNPFQYRVKNGLGPSVDIILEPGSALMVEPGSLQKMTGGIQRTVPVSKIFGGLGRVFSGEDFFTTKLSNAAQSPHSVTLAAPYVGEIMPIDLDTMPGQAIICQRNAFLAGPDDTSVKSYWKPGFRAGIFGGDGFVMQKVSGHGTIFLHAGGSLEKTALAKGDRLLIDTGCLLAVSEGVKMDIDVNLNPMNAVFGKEGLVLATVEAVNGDGAVWTQTMPLSKQVSQMAKAMGIPQRKPGLLSRIGFRND